MRDLYISEYLKAAKKDSSRILITADLGFGVLDNFFQSCPSQIINVGICEQNMIGVAAGLASEGYKPLLYSIGNFPLLRCLEQIRNTICYHDLDVKILSVGAGFSYGQLGFSHHATEDISIARSMPNLQVYSPCDDLEVCTIAKNCLSISSPAYIRLDKSKLLEKFQSENKLNLNTGIRELISGENVCILATGGIVTEAIEASRLLKIHGINVAVFSVSTIQPLPFTELNGIIEKYPSVFSLEENTIRGGFGSAIAEFIVQRKNEIKVFQSFGISSGFQSVVGSQTFLRQLEGLSGAELAMRIWKCLA